MTRLISVHLSGQISVIDVQLKELEKDYVQKKTILEARRTKFYDLITILEGDGAAADAVEKFKDLLP